LLDVGRVSAVAEAVRHAVLQRHALRLSGRTHV
jgi:hypothetical protein